MRKITVCFFTLVWLLCPVGGNAAYLIKLKNGKEFVTSRYWQEGSQIMFDTYGGVFGVDRTFVARIEQSDKAVRLPTVTQDAPEQQPQADTADGKEPAKPSPPVEKKPQDKTGEDPLLKEFTRLKEKSNGIQGLLTSEIETLLKELTVFKNKISTNSKFLIDHAREYNEIHEISSSVEEALRSRTQ